MIMTKPATDLFFTQLPIHDLSLSRLLEEAHLFVDVPQDWHVVVTDIKNSTNAFMAGRHEEINLVATGSIIATLNLAYRANLQVPFFFGGDGATMIVPESLRGPVTKALLIHRENTIRSYDMELRVGTVSVAGLNGKGHDLKISRVLISDGYTIPIVLGKGLSEAERMIKQDDGPVAFPSDPSNDLDLEGMECRWDRVEPEGASHEVVCLLVTAQTEAAQGIVFKQVIDLIDTIYGPYTARNPVSVSKLKLKGGLQKLALEMRTRLGGFSLPYLIRNWLVNLYGRLFYLRSDEGRQYMQQLVGLTDTLVIDGRINTVIAGTAKQRSRLEQELMRMEQAGLIAYGLFTSNESVMSCYVRDRKNKHIHFVDGADGGYTMAAAMLKQKQ